MGLLDDLESKDKKGLFHSDDAYVTYSTGILPLDYANGFWQEVRDKDGNVKQIPSLGVMGGTFITVIGTTGTGKAIPNDAMIPTPDGLIEMGNLKVGDYVLDRYGKHTKVLGVYPQGIKPCYQLTFSDGKTARSCNEHIWSVYIWESDDLHDRTLDEIMIDYKTEVDGEMYYAYSVPICETKHDYAFITDIKRLDDCEQTCIYVDNEEHLFLTENRVVTHNTTFADQLAYNIIKPFEDGVMYHIDAEKTATKQRLIQLAGAKYDDPRIKLIKNHTSIDDVLDMVTRICDAKEAGGDKYKYQLKELGFDGKPVKMYVPTVFIIDSLPSFNARDYNVEDLGNNIDQMRAAKDVTRFFTNCLDRAWQYNITFIVVNHIRPKADMNPYAAPPKGLLMLGPAESLPRGTVAQYNSQTFIRINARKSDEYTMEDHGFKGRKCTFQLAKTKTNAIGVSFPVAFNGEIGFDPIYTLFEFASDIGLINGRNPYLYFDGLDTFKFSRKNFRNMIIENEAFRESVLDVLRPHLEALLGSKKAIDEESHQLQYGDLTL